MNNQLHQDFWFCSKSNMVAINSASAIPVSYRNMAAFSDGYLSADIMQLLTASFFFVSCLSLKPEPLVTQALMTSNSLINSK